MEAKMDLTSFLQEPTSHAEVVALLEDAGLELWQSPEGFWAIRIKAPIPPAPRQVRARRRR